MNASAYSYITNQALLPLLPLLTYVRFRADDLAHVQTNTV